MTEKRDINGTTLSLVKGDITDLEIDAFVYYARPDLKLGSGYGTAITMRGGPSIQKQLDDIGPLNTTESVVSSAGEMKANFIVHAVGPAFQEEELEEKLRQTILNALKEAESKGITEIAFPPMGAGFYGVPLKESARITLSSVAEYLRGDTNLKNVVICLLDNREFTPFRQELDRMADTIKETV